MRICLTTTQFLPTGQGGIQRHRHILAKALTRMEHEVHIVTQGVQLGASFQEGYIVHTIPTLSPPPSFSKKFTSINAYLSHSLGILEQIRLLNREYPLDILDVPLWGLEGFIPICADEMPVILWLQTSLAQIVALDRRSPKEDEIGIIALEKECLKRACGIISDSHTLLTDFEKLWNLKDIKERTQVIPLGIPDLPESQRGRHRDRNFIEILLVGRLEKRKGTQFIFNNLARLLSIDKRIVLRFVGADNSPWDGFYDQYQLSYPEYFRDHWPGLAERVIFEGSVSESRLVEAYNQADIMLVPSLYESFGLIYLEAMRAGLPVITFNLGSAPEIFPQGDSDGVLLVPAEDSDALCTAIQDLASNPIRRSELGAHGRERFLNTFLDNRMAEKTVAYYRENLAARKSSGTARPRRLFQVMDSLDIGDAVSSIALRNAKLLREIGVGGAILGLQAHPQISDKYHSIKYLDPAANAALIYHYWNFSPVEDYIRRFSGPKAIHFHNITPPEYFDPMSLSFRATTLGYQQLARMINLFDLIIGDSSFNLEVCRPYLSRPRPSIVIPPAVDSDEIRQMPYDKALLDELSRQQGTKFLFVGRIARNKRQDRLIEMFDAYYRSFDSQSWLYLVGSGYGDPQYRADLEALRLKLPSKDHIVFTGKVSQEALVSYYRAARLFVCASEHEGFCLPIVEAMALDLPVLAFAATAIPETIGKSGILFQEWDSSIVIEQAYSVISNAPLREKILTNQRENLLRFDPEHVKELLSAVVRFLRSFEFERTSMAGNDQSLISTLAPVPRVEVKSIIDS